MAWVASLLPAGWVNPTPVAPFYPVAPLTAAAQSTLTGIDTTALAAVLFGKDIPVFVGGEALMGCRIIEGPFIYEVAGAQYVDFIATCALSANPTGTRTITSLRLNGTESWTSAGGPIGTPFAGMTVHATTNTGTETQTPFASSVVRYGTRAVAYRSHICVEVIKCPLDVFNNVVPFASIFVHEADSITRNAALAVLATYARYATTEVDFDVAGSDTFWIVPQQTEFIQYLQNLRRIFRNWNITATDKLRVFENAAADGITSTITRSTATAGSIKFIRTDPKSIERQRAVSFIDTERDNDMNSVQARLESFPVATTASQGANTIELPIGMTASAAQLLVNKSLLIDDLARKKMAFTGMNALYGSEPGDIVYFADDTNITFLGRITSVARKAADYGTDCNAEQIDFSLLPNIAPAITSNGGGSTASITINENTTAVTTVVATDANLDLLTYSISGGADAAKFTINGATGVLAFLVAPNFEVPTDADLNNQYVVIVEASDGDLSDTQTITVTVANVAEGAVATPIGLLLALTREP
jgi:hypothetical protein